MFYKFGDSLLKNQLAWAPSEWCVSERLPFDGSLITRPWICFSLTNLQLKMPEIFPSLRIVRLMLTVLWMVLSLLWESVLILFGVCCLFVQLLTHSLKDYSMSCLCQTSLRHICVSLFLCSLFCSVNPHLYSYARITLSCLLELHWGQSYFSLYFSLSGLFELV